jgi:hypothetical protein
MRGICGPASVHAPPYGSSTAQRPTSSVAKDSTEPRRYASSKRGP